VVRGKRPEWGLFLPENRGKKSSESCIVRGKKSNEVADQLIRKRPNPGKDNRAEGWRSRVARPGAARHRAGSKE